MMAATPYPVRGLAAPGVLALDRNEGASPSPDLLTSLADHGPGLLRTYPDAAALERLLAERLGLDPACVLVTAGADDAIDRCCRAFLRERRELVHTEPTFEMVARYGALAGARRRTVPWTSGRFPVDGFLALRTDATGLAVIVSPNNPTGLAATAEQIRQVADALARTATPMLLDHVYVEYADADCTGLVREFPDLVVVRTLSKAWGLAGCRVGYAVGAPSRITALRASGAPFAVAAPSLQLAAARLRNGDRSLIVHLARVREGRSALTRFLIDRRVPTLPSEANFVLACFGNRAGQVIAGLEVDGILVRDLTGLEALPGAVRIGIPEEPADFDRLTAALERALLQAGVIS